MHFSKRFYVFKVQPVKEEKKKENRAERHRYAKSVTRISSGRLQGGWEEGMKKTWWQTGVVKRGRGSVRWQR